MANPYRRFSSIERDERSTFAGYPSSDHSTNGSHQMWSAADPRGTSDFLRSDVGLNVLPPHSGSYGLDVHTGIGSHATAGHNGFGAGGVVRGTTPLEDPALRRRDLLGGKPGIVNIDESSTLLKSDDLSPDESNILFVDGLPTNCTRREVAHLFRPFIGFEEIRVMHKEPRHTGDKAYVLCFVEFKDSKCALTALEALQGYKFDDKKPDSPVLKIQFAKFPFRRASVVDDRKPGSNH